MALKHPEISLAFVSTSLDLCNAWATAILYGIPCYTDPHYDGSQPYHRKFYCLGQHHT